MLLNVPARCNLGRTRLPDPSIIVNILEEHDSPIFRWGKVQECKHWVSLYGLYDKIDIILRFLIVLFVGMHIYLMEAGIDHIAAQLLQLE